MFGLSGWFADNELLIASALSLTLLASSYQVTIRAGVSSFAGVAFWGLGAYGTAAMVIRGVQVYLAVALALLICLAFAALLHLVLTRIDGLYLAMSTVAVVLLLQNLAGEWTDITGGPLGLYAVPGQIGLPALAAVVAAALALLAVWEKGSTGRAIETMRTDPDLATSLGIDRRRYRLLVMAFSSLLGGLSGAAYVLTFNIVTPHSVGFGPLVIALEAMVIGGLMYWSGPLIGAVIVTWLPVWLRAAEDWRPIALAVLVLVMVIYSPGGIVGLLKTAWDAGRRRAGAVRPAPAPPAEARRQNSATGGIISD